MSAWRLVGSTHRFQSLFKRAMTLAIVRTCPSSVDCVYKYENMPRIVIESDDCDGGFCLIYYYGSGRLIICDEFIDIVCTWRRVCAFIIATAENVARYRKRKHDIISALDHNYRPTKGHAICMDVCETI